MDDLSVYRKMVRHRRSAWLVIGASITVLLLTFVFIAIVDAGGTELNTHQHSPTGHPSVAETATVPRSVTPVPASVQPGIGLVADPEWVKRVSNDAQIPPRVLAAYAGAALVLAREQPSCGLSWNTLAAIGQVESDHGRINGSEIRPNGRAEPPIYGPALTGATTDKIVDTDGGALDGDVTWDKAVGPMQFIPSTWQLWAADGNNDGVKDPQNIDDSALTAARYLCGVGGDLNKPEAWIAAIATYNNTIEYNNRVVQSATFYAQFS